MFPKKTTIALHQYAPSSHSKEVINIQLSMTQGAHFHPLTEMRKDARRKHPHGARGCVFSYSGFSKSGLFCVKIWSISLWVSPTHPRWGCPSRTPVLRRPGGSGAMRSGGRISPGLERRGKSRPWEWTPSSGCGRPEPGSSRNPFPRSAGKSPELQRRVWNRAAP